MMNYTENTAYNKHLFNIAHSCDIETLEQIRFAIVCDVELDSFDMVNDLSSRIDKLEAIFSA